MNKYFFRVSFKSGLLIFYGHYNAILRVEDQESTLPLHYKIIPLHLLPKFPLTLKSYFPKLNSKKANFLILTPLHTLLT